MQIRGLLALGLAVLAVQSAFGQQNGGSFTSQDGNYKASWTVVSNGFIEISMSAKTTGWVAFGYKATNRGPHVDTAMIVGTVSGGRPEVLERYSRAVGSPDLLFENPNRIVNGSEANGWTNIVFRRPIASLNGITIPNSAVLVQWAYGQIDTFVQHAPRARGSFSANLLAASRPRPTTTPAPVANPRSFSSPDGNYKASWSVSNGDIKISITAKTTGWVGFGYNSPDSKKPHQGTQMASFTVFPNDGLSGSSEYRSFDFGRPSLMFENPNFIVNASEANGVTSVVFTRPIAGGASVLPIANAPILVHWAYGSTDQFLQHSTTARGTVTVNLLA